MALSYDQEAERYYENTGIAPDIFQELCFNKQSKVEQPDSWVSEPIKTEAQDTSYQSARDDKSHLLCLSTPPSEKESPELECDQSTQVDLDEPLVDQHVEAERCKESQVVQPKELDHEEPLINATVIKELPESIYQVNLSIKSEPPEIGPLRARRDRSKQKLANYNLRRKSSKVLSVNKLSIWINKKLGRDCFRDKALQKVDLDTYHEGLISKDDRTLELLKLSRQIRRSQLDRFTHNSRKYLIITWLSVARIFEYNSEESYYFEVTRLPKRYIDIQSDKITSIRYHAEKVYIAYMTCEPKKAYIEIRDLNRRLLGPRYYYDETIETILSDKEFIYITTIDNNLHMHNKNHFHLICYHINLHDIINDNILFVKAKVAITNPYMMYHLCVATKKQVIILNYDAFRTSVVQNYNLDGRFETISAHYLSGKVLLHRNLIKPTDGAKFKSKIEVGIYLRIKGQYYFIHERTINHEYHIAQVETTTNDNTFFIFGRDDRSRYEICCVDADDFKPIWSTKLADGVDDNAKMLIHDDHVAIISQQDQKISCIRTKGRGFNDCQMLRFAETQINVNF